MTEPPSWPAPSGDQPDRSGYGTPPPPPPPPYGAPPPGYGPPSGWGPPQYGAPPPDYGYGYPGYQGYQPYAAVAAKPGIIPLRPLAVGEILDGAFTTIRRHPKATLGLSAIVACLQQGASLALQALTGTVSSGGGVTGLRFNSTSNSSGGDVARSLTGTFAILLVNLVFSAILTGMLCLVVSDSVLGRPSTAGAAWQRVKPMAWRVLGASLLVGFCQILGLVLCILPGAFLWGAWALVMPALVLERIGILAAIRRSYRLVTPNFWRVFGIRVLSSFIAAAVAAPFAAITLFTGANDLFSQLDTSGNTTASVHLSATTIIVGAVVGVIVTTLTAPFVAGMLTLLYIDRRIRAEALDVQLQQAALNQPGGAAVPAPPAYG
ncbi:MAG: hypothetical protein QOJ11_4490 [Frankiales bacterium]|jgi:hypothetical protein|nr:hypothetical protein [Frankiales bacterium]